jgi:hypothetical protein
MGSDPEPGSRWFYVQGGRRQGPVELPRLVEVLLSLEAPDEALVWQPGMPEWVRAGSLEALRRELPPPVPRSREESGPDPVPPDAVPASPGETSPQDPGSPAALVGTPPEVPEADAEDSRVHRRRHRHRHKKGVISRDFRPYVLPLLVLLLTMVLALWYVLRRVNEVPPGRILLQGDEKRPDAPARLGATPMSGRFSSPS